MKINHFVIIVFFFSLSGCNNCSEEKSYSMNHGTKTLPELKQQIIDYGDTCAYYDLKIQLLDFKYGDEELLSYAMIMANKYDYSEAYFDVFDCITAPYFDNINQIDSRTAKMAIDYLLLASEKGYFQACEIVDSYSITRTQGDCREQIRNIYK